MSRIVYLVALSIVTVFMLISCGGGGSDGGGSVVTPPSQSLQGTYSLSGFQVNYSNGTTINENSSSITSWSGTMKIGTNSFSQSAVINGITAAISGTATISWTTPNVSGIAHVTDSSGTHDVAFTISGNDLSTYSGVMPSGTPGVTFQEWDYWTKVSDSLAPVRISTVTDNSIEPIPPENHWIGELLIP